MSLAMRMRMWSSVRDARACSFCIRDSIYVLEMQSGQAVTVTRFCQFHIDEMRTMLGVIPEQFYPKEIING